MFSGPDYEAADDLQRERNLQKVLDCLDGSGQQNQNLTKRIRRFSKNFGYSEEVVVAKIRDDEMFRAHFIPDTRKQNIDKKIAFDWLKQQPGIQDIKELPTNARSGAFFVLDDGKIATVNSERPSKSLDFRWKTKSTTFYAIHKRTTDDGGSQGKGKSEMEVVLQNFQGCNTNNVALVIMFAGDYWTEDRVADMQRFVREDDPRSFAVTIDKVPAILEDY